MKLDISVVIQGHTTESKNRAGPCLEGYSRAASPSWKGLQRPTPDFKEQVHEGQRGSALVQVPKREAWGPSASGASALVLPHSVLFCPDPPDPHQVGPSLHCAGWQTQVKRGETHADPSTGLGTHYTPW